MENSLETSMEAPEPSLVPPSSRRGRSPGSKATQFQPGHPGRRKPPQSERVAAGFDRLAAMRHVLSNPASTDATEGEKACRVWLRKSPGQFMEALDRLEGGPKATTKDECATSEQPLVPTESDMELRRMIVELLDRHEKAARLPRT